MLDTDLCWCGSGRIYKVCHKSFDERLKSVKLKKFRQRCARLDCRKYLRWYGYGNSQSFGAQLYY